MRMTQIETCSPLIIMVFNMEELNELSSLVRPQLSALHLNIPSLNRHYNELCSFLDIIFIQFDLITCSETWIAPQVDPGCFDIQGYNMLIDNRLSSTGGRLALYLRSIFDYSLRNDLEWIALKTSENIDVIYNPRGRCQREFLPQFEDFYKL